MNRPVRSNIFSIFSVLKQLFFVDSSVHLHVSLQMWWGTLGTVRPFLPFDPVMDARQIYAALEKKSTDVMTLVRIITNRTNAQRQSIATAYNNLTQKDLGAALKKALSGPLEELLLALMMTPAGFDASRLRQAMEGLGTDEEALLEVLCTRSPDQLRDITVAYKEGKRQPSNPVADSGYQGQCGKKSDPAPWIQILTSRSLDHLNRGRAFRNLRLKGEAVDKTIQKHFSGDLRLGLRILGEKYLTNFTLINNRNPTQININAVVRGILVARSEEDLLWVRVEFRKLANVSLYTTIQKEFKGDLQAALLALCRSEDV
uniref:Annexin n=1 Tax=Electrophorus electricus TaxID=8005 RepID=A0AAY5EPD3_ELEEL